MTPKPPAHIALASLCALGLAAAGTLALAGCNTWAGAKQDAREVGGTVTHAVGTGLEKAGGGIETAGEKVKKVGN